MSTPITFNGASYNVPAFGDTGYAQGAGNLSLYLVAIATGTLQQTGGTFSLTADVNFGLNFGLASLYYKSITSNIATAGVIRLAKTDSIDWRNNANSANLPLAINGSDQLTFNGSVLNTGMAVSSVSGTTNQINSTGGTTPVLSLSSTLVFPGTISANSNKITSLANGTVSTDAAAFGQIFYGFQAAIQATTETPFTTTSSTYQSTNLTATIAPTSASHRIRITASGGMQLGPTLNVEGFATIFRNSTDLGAAAGTGFAISKNELGTQTQRDNVAFSFIDSPATTSPVVYTIKIKNTDNTTSIEGFASGDTEKCVLILEEIV